MQYLGLFGTLAVLFLTLWGLVLVTGFVFRSRWVALAAGPLMLVTAGFCLESLVGLGPLRGVGLLGVLVSVVLVALSAGVMAAPARWRTAVEAWRTEFAPRQLLWPAAVFSILFFYALGWRFAFPDIDGSSEKIADLAYIASYLTGRRIPVVDAWLDPHLSVQYYSLQHYGAALLGRLLGLSPGATYNLAFCFLVALIGSAFTGAVVLQTGSHWARGLLVAAFVLGGTGVSGLVHLTDATVQPWSGMRYIGSSPFDQLPLGPWLKAHADGYARMDMPGEPFSYSIYLGDYHAPLSGYLLLSLAVAAAVLWHQSGQRRYAGLVGATLTWSVLSNTWILPLQGLAVVVWIVFNRREWLRLAIPVVVGAASVWLAAGVYLSAFTAATAGYNTAIRPVAWSQHAPPLLFLAFLAPTIGLSVLALLRRDRLSRWIGLAGLGFLAISEFVYVDDIYSAEFERFNTTLKWWPWIAAAVLLVAGPRVLAATGSRAVRIAGALLCGYTLVFAIDLAGVWLRTPKPSFGKLDGTRYLTQRVETQLLLERLKLEPHGLAIERPEAKPFTNSAVLPLFAGHRLWLGWLGHEQLWRGYREDLPQRLETLTRFFDASLERPGDWLRGQGIDYVLWYQPDDTQERWETLHGQISGRYAWTEVFVSGDGRRVGYWKRD